jgi:hypothetical protein
MKSLRFFLPVVLLSLSTVPLAQSDAQESLDKLKNLLRVPGKATWQRSRCKPT